MANVPIYNKPTVEAHATPQPSQVNGDAFGENIAKATYNLGRSMNKAFDTAVEIKNTIDNAHLLELSNSSEQWEQENLYDKDKGYYYKMGKNAAGKSKDVLEQYDKNMQNAMSKYSFTPGNRIKAQAIIARKRDRISAGVNAHDFKQTQNYANTETELGIENAVNTAINNRNDQDAIATQMQNGLTLIDVQANLMHFDSSQTQLAKDNFKSTFHEKMISAYLSENSLKAGEYLEKHKTEINAEKLPQLMAMCKDNELNYTARSTALGLLNMSTEDAYKAINNIENPQERMATEREYNNFLRQQKTIQDEKDAKVGNAIMEEVYSLYDKGVPMSEIMARVNRSDMSVQAKKAVLGQLKDMEEMEGYGNEWADYNFLLDLADENHERFANVNLSQYRLTKEQFMDLTKMQRNAANIQYSTEAQLRKAIKSWDTSFNPQTSHGLKQTEYEQDVIRFLSKIERLQGKAFDLKKLDQGQFEALKQAFGYKDKNAKNKNIDEFKELYERAKKHGDIEGFVTKEYMAFKMREKREPKPEEAFEMVKRGYNTIENQVKQYGIDKINQVTNLNKNINAVVPKSGETKVLTYFADTQVKEIGKKLGVNFTIVDGGRYRAGDSGGHGKGRKCDVSMSEFDIKTRLKAFEEFLSLPNVTSIGTSDPAILKIYAGHPKVRDLRNYDTNYKKTHPNSNMNHINHFDISLDTRFGGESQNFPNYKPQQLNKTQMKPQYSNYRKTSTGSDA